MANWDNLGELDVINTIQFFPNDAISEVFKITTTILNIDDWEKWKFRSSAYLVFYYADGSTSPKYRISYNQYPVIREFLVPDALKNQGYILRTSSIIRASRYLPITPNQNFAEWRIKLESLL